jgi:hypothetical protein
MLPTPVAVGAATSPWLAAVAALGTPTFDTVATS